ncbi:DNA polymerase-3 subunit delta' [Dysgonomonas sp. PFB1-18]|uniref:DNA polymerase III subunit delta' n=1 Tax=unclassified Dysgonomonas TaxID=2630389 RepID=UPI0024748854|nr:MULTISPECIES: DNA polymerase III subunit delta' [unclassified Dysgonomonas]MDH6309869.1 DNA polymerase-3 subunit delta' [Dysgonomonas sp. PF1-14]MDH6339413.1 DNA polymerase-3 subunit delta' [Dysgonomonas sp. PF1-16]MDH6380912.1 DNA polymerase-3 subunit delta' [Dysgonomonas sp. PFB1-18]MDH6397921.1 DNA polymerase-3 subunit delta' [Dysgonomonas sp. PF1-23]
MLFKDIVGQGEVKERLTRTVREGFIPHAQLFCGPEGIGKFPLALAYAQYLNCENPSETDSCGKCLSCVKYNNMAHPDLHFVFPIVKKAAKKKEVCDDYIADWREFVKQRSYYFNLNQWLEYIEAENSQGLIYAKESEEILRKLSLRIYEAKYKVMIIWLPEKMHESCANKLLKIIEEPTDNTVFLLVSDTPDNIITTIQSRCQRINIHGVKEADIMQALESEYNITPDDAANVAHLSKGSYLKATETISLNEEHKFFFNLFVQMMRASYARNIKEIKAIGNELGAIGRENQKSFLIYSQRMIREYFVSNLSQPEMVYLAQDETNFGTRFAPFINERNIIGFMDELALAERHIEQNVNAKMVFFDLCLKITMLIKQ